MKNNYTNLLMHMDEGSFKDECQHAVTINGVTLDKTTKKIGTGSAFFNGSSNLSIPTSLDFDLGSNNFTIDMWVYPTSVNSYKPLYTKRKDTSTYGNLVVCIHDGNLTIYATSNGSSWDIASDISFGAVAINQWNHIAICRNETSIYGFVNGVKGNNTVTTSTAINPNTDNVLIGGEPGYYVDGYIDEVRVTKGEALWTSDFIPPTEATKLELTEEETIINTARAKGDNTNNPGGSVSLVFKGVAETQLSVVKTADVDSVYVGDTFTYTIVVTNTSSKTAKTVVMSDNAPNHIDFSVSGVTTTQGKVDSSSTSKNIIVNVGDIPPSGTVTIKIPATVIL